MSESIPVMHCSKIVEITDETFHGFVAISDDQLVLNQY